MSTAKDTPSNSAGARLARGIGKRLSALAFIGICMAALCAAWLGTQGFMVISDGGELTALKVTRGMSADEALNRAGIKLGSHDSVELDRNGLFSTAEVSRAYEVAVSADGETETLLTVGETAGELLRRAGVELTKLDSVDDGGEECDLSHVPGPGGSLNVTRRSVEYTTAKREIPYISIVEETEFLYEGEKKVTSEGENGEKTLTYANIVADGEIAETYLMSERTTKDVVNAVTLEGTKEKPAPVVTTTKTQTYMGGHGGSTSGTSVASSYEGGGGTVTTHSGQTLSYSRVLQCTATAYYEPPETRITASGTIPHWGVIAVDPRVIPLGTTVYITNLSGTWEYGVSSAEDTGGVIKGNKVDLFMNSVAECYDYGRGQVLVYILD